MEAHVSHVSMILESVQVCAGAKVLCDCDVLSVNGDAIISEVFQGLCMGQIESADGFHLLQQYIDSPVSCAIAHSSTDQFQSISLSVKVQIAVEFGKYFKYVLRSFLSMICAKNTQYTNMYVCMYQQLYNIYKNWFN